VSKKKPTAGESEVKPFTAVDLPRQLPAKDVADHQVFMSFVNDDDAIDFREWWDDAGALAFAEWLVWKREENKS
jgi:hypothetical protein